jgi:hypothetical protein
VEDRNGHQRSPGAGNQAQQPRSRNQASTQGRPSMSLPTAAASPASSCLQGGGSPGRASPSGRPGSRRRQVRASSFSPPCHPRAISSGHQRYVAVSHGHSAEALGLRTASDLGWGRRPKLHGMQGVRGSIPSPMPSQISRGVASSVGLPSSASITKCGTTSSASSRQYSKRAAASDLSILSAIAHSLG